jgi:HAD superfamily hydrolase (TIGR01490 family)
MTELAEVYIDSLKGKNMEHLDFIANQVIDLKGDKVYSFTRGRIEWHKKQGHKIFFISGSPDHLVSKMAEKYGVTDFKATEYVKNKDGRFTGEVIPMWDSDSKNKSIAQLVELYDIDIENSYAYGDTNGDYSMLKLVNNPVAINPSSGLVEHIKRDKHLSDKATIIVERKDVIYKLDASVSIITT